MANATRADKTFDEIADPGFGFDIRDVIERYEALEAQFDDESETLTESYPDAETANCGTCGRDFPDVFPSPRCPYEYSHDESAEKESISDFLDDVRGYGGDEQWRGDWYPLTFIADSHFEDYARELAEDLGAINTDIGWPMRCIDWEQAASELQTDYTSTEINGVTYWYR